MDHGRVVYGESVRDLLPGLLAFRSAMKRGDDGMYRSSVTLQPAEGAPLRRALMRVEAELLREDADTVGSDHEQDRSYDQRAADALVHLVQTINPSSDG